MSGQTHVLLLGFDVQRLVKPLSTGNFSPDTVFLIRDERDPNSGSQSREQLLIDTQTELERSLDQYLDVETEKRNLPLSTNFADAFEAFYNLLDDLAPNQDVSFNVSAAPKSAVLALQAARETWLSDHPEHEQTIELYYFRPERYFETDLRECLDELADAVETVEKEQQRFERKTEAELAGALTAPVADAVERVENCREDVEKYIENAVDSAASDIEEDDDSLIDSVTDKVEDRVESILGDDVEPNEELTELLKYLEAAEDLSSEITANPLRNVEGFRLEYNEKIRQHEVPDEYAEPLRAAIDDLEARVETMYETRSSLKNSFGALQESIEDASSTATEAERLLEDISRSGMTEGVVGKHADWKVPTAPTSDLRDIEQIMLYVLVKQGTQRSVQALARATARELRKLGRQIGKDPSSIEMPTESKNYCMRMEADDDIGDDFEEFVADRLRNRLQYNLDSLEEAGYVTRVEAADDSRRKEIVLSDTGTLWGTIRNTSEIERIALEEELRDQLSAFVEEQQEG
jgi:chaperonin cofactor prefoldin